MPELQLCHVCRQPIRAADDFVIPNRDDDPRYWTYVHERCYVPEPPLPEDILEPQGGNS